MGEALSSALGDEVALLASVVAIVHGKLQHAFHEDCAVPHTGPIHIPGVNVVCVGAHDDVPVRPIHCECQIRMAVQGI